MKTALFSVSVQFLMVYFLVHLRFVGMVFASPVFLAAGMPLPFRYLFCTFLTVAAAGSLESVTVSTALFESWLSIFFLALR